MSIVVDQNFIGGEEGNWTDVTGTAEYGTFDRVKLPTGTVIGNTTDTFTSILGSSTEIVFSMSANTCVFTISLFDGTQAVFPTINFGGTSGEIATIDTDFPTPTNTGAYSYAGDDVKMTVRVSVDDRGQYLVYMDNVLIPNYTGGTDLQTDTYIRLTSGGTGTISVYSMHAVDQFLDPSDPLPHADYSRGTLYCTNDKVRTTGKPTFYSTEKITSKTGTSQKVQLDWGFKVKQFDKFTVAAGKLPQLTQMKFSPSTDEFAWTPPLDIELGDSLIATDLLWIKYQSHFTDENINKIREEVQVTVNNNMPNIATTPLTPSTLYDEVVIITANLTKLTLLKDAQLRHQPGEYMEVDKQWKYWMDYLINLKTLTLNGAVVSSSTYPTMERTNSQETMQSNLDQRKIDFDAGG